MAEARKPASATRLRVLRTERITPHMVRIVAGGEEIASFQPNGFTDAYVKVHFRVPGVAYPEPFDLAKVREELPREQWPRMRSYTVRAFDRDLGELVLDFVHHGDEGIAGPWAASAKPGDEVLISGPGGAYTPGEEADWHLLAGDESALPAIAASLEAMPAGVPAHAVILVEDAAEEQTLTTKAEARITWLHRSRGDDLAAAVRALDWHDGVVQAFVHGEAAFVRDVRRHLLDERGMRRDLLSISGYWRAGKSDEAWREEKRAERNA